MPSPAQITSLRRHRHNRAGRYSKTWFGVGCSTFLSLFAVLVGMMGVWGYITLFHNLPSLETLPALLDPPDGLLLQPTRLYDRTGTHVLLELENPAAVDRQVLTLQSNQPNYLPSSLISATLATADPQFWSHAGYSFDGLTSGTHPTLAQTLVSDLLLWSEPASLRRAVRERLLAAQITARFGRQQVLIWYLNSANYGRLAFGADVAARVYFNKPAAEINLAEAAVLAAVMQSPALNPLDAPNVVRERAVDVIQTMLEGGWINAAQASQARKSNLVFRTQTETLANPAPIFINLVLEQLGQELSLNRLERGGFQIVTTLDQDLQFQAACALQLYTARLQGMPDPPNTMNGDECRSARLLPTSFTGQSMTVKDIKGNLVILDHRTGEILAMIGEISPGLDPAHYPGHPAGSLLTPFIYLTGFTRGLNPASMLWDIPSGSNKSFNLDGSFHGPLRLRTALANDDLVPAEQVSTQVGAENVWRLAKQFGLEAARLPDDASVTDLLQESEVTLLDISRAYGVLANQGLLAGRENTLSPGNTPPSTAAATIIRLEDATGKVWINHANNASHPVVSPQLAYLMTHILSDEPARWSMLGHPNPLEIGRPFAAKLGRTGMEQDVWAVGSTPYMTIGIWLGQASQGKISVQEAAALLHAVAQYATRNHPPDGWSMPAGINSLAVCDPSGMLPTPDCPTVVNEIFIAGTEPTSFDTLFRRLQINRESGMLATVFTPPELVEERVYLQVPPEAQEWARQAGLPTPPDTYDVILADTSPSADVKISSPSMFAYVGGKVRIMGTARGSNFEIYRLQVGQGLNPKNWLQVGQDSQLPVSDNLLGSWDTQGLSGLYSMQLLVIQQDQRVQSDVIQVTVDNQSPELSILYPTDGQIVPLSNQTITLQAQVNDDLALKNVEFYIDDRLVSNLTQPPYTITWQARLGAHSLRIKAVDQAGNTAEARIAFKVE